MDLAFQWCRIKVPQSNFLSTVILKFDYVFFLESISISFKFIRCTESVQQRKHWVGHKNGQNIFLWPTNDSFDALTQCDKLILRKWQKNAKKGDIVKIENHCTKKIRLGCINVSSGFSINIENVMFLVKM